MAQFKRKNTHRFWYSPLFLLVLFCVFILFMYNMVGLIKKERETSRNKSLELNKIDELRKREVTLSSEIDKLNTPEGIETSVRDKFQVVKPGEKEVLIVQDQTKVSSLDIVIDHSFWGYIKKMFGFK